MKSLSKNNVNALVGKKDCKTDLRSSVSCIVLSSAISTYIYRIYFPKRKYHILHNTCFTNTKNYDYEKETHDGGSAARCVDIGRLRG